MGRPVEHMFSKLIVNNPHDLAMFGNLYPVKFDCKLKLQCKQAGILINHPVVNKFFTTLRSPWVVTLPCKPTSDTIKRWKEQVTYIVDRIVASTGIDESFFVSEVHFNTVTNKIPPELRILIDPNVAALTSAMLEERELAARSPIKSPGAKTKYPHGHSSL